MQYGDFWKIHFLSSIDSIILMILQYKGLNQERKLKINAIVRAHFFRTITP